MKVMAMSYSKQVFFNSLEEAAEYTLITIPRIKWCINTGCRWKTWTFDEVIE